MNPARTMIAVVLLSLCGCSLVTGPYPGEQRRGSSTSLVDYLYPDGEMPADVAARVPTLELPLRVGLAIIPDDGHSNPGITESGRQDLLSSIREQFVGLDYVEDIQIIPSTYLRAGKSTVGMQRVAQLFDVDVMALVSYDQVARTFENKQSLLYWTIVGAYVVQGTEHDTSTFLDLAVVDVRTSKLLLRAPGFNERHGNTTHVDADRALLLNSGRGFEAAVEMLNQNLAIELVAFEERLQSRPDEIQTSWRGGGGAIGVMALGLLGCLVAWRWGCAWRRPDAGAANNTIS